MAARRPSTSPGSTTSRIRVQNYQHWDDPVITESLRSYDGVLLVTSSEPIPAWTSKHAGAGRRRRRAVGRSDALGHPVGRAVSAALHARRCSIGWPTSATGAIDCLNVQGHNSITVARIDAWRDWSSRPGNRRRVLSTSLPRRRQRVRGGRRERQTLVSANAGRRDGGACA